jgi:hypothetical protein
MHLGHAAQLGQGVLQAVAEALEALREADGAGLPVRVGQHEVVDQVRKRLSVNGHLETAGVRDVGGAQVAGLVDLTEEHLLGRPVQGAPLLDVPLQGAQLPVGQAAGVLTLQPFEHRLGLQAGIEGQLLLDARPELREGVGTRPPGMLHAYLAGQPVEPAVLARGLVVDAGLGGSLALGQSLVVEPGNLIVVEGRDDSRRTRKSNRRRAGYTVAVHHPTGKSTGARGWGTPLPGPLRGVGSATCRV